jgi:hypothetical protein
MEESLGANDSNTRNAAVPCAKAINAAGATAGKPKRQNG